MTAATERTRVLVVDDEPVVVELIVAALDDQGYELRIARSLAEGRAALAEEPALAVIDKNLPDGSGIELIAELKQRWPLAEAIVFTGYPSFDSVVGALRLGAYDYLSKPPRDVDELRHKVARALERRTLLAERERTLAELREALRLQAMAAHSETMAQLGRLMSGIVHELRTPLTYASGNLEFLLHALRAGEPATQEHIDAIAESFKGLRRIAEISADVRHVSSLSAHDPGRREPVRLAEVVEMATTLTAGEVRRHAQVELSVEDAVAVLGSKVRLTQVLVNLLVNAAHAIAGSGKGRGRILVQVSGEAARARLAVQDDGGGIPPELVERIFEPFFTTKGDHGGTGLGLALAREIAVEHGGTLAVESTPRVGSRFILELPLLGAGA